MSPKNVYRYMQYLLVVAIGLQGVYSTPVLAYGSVVQDEGMAGNALISDSGIVLMNTLPQAGLSAAVFDITATCNVEKESVDTGGISSENLLNEDKDKLVVSTSEIPVFMYRSNTLSGDVVGMLPSGGAGELLAEGNTWSLVRSGYYTGFVDSSCLLSGDGASDYADKHFDKEGRILSDTAFAYENSDLTGAVVSVLAKDSSVTVMKANEDSCAIEIGEMVGYLKSSDVAVQNIYQCAEEPDIILYGDLYPDEALASYENSDSYDASQVVTGVAANPSGDCLAIMNEIVEYALRFLGRPYVWGGESLMYGCDCSGFVMKVYEHFGYSLPHSSAALRSVGYDVCGSVWDEGKALPGDIICYDGHVGIYIGDGEMVNAASKKTGIKISKVTARDDFICARRVVSGHSSNWNLTDKEYEELCRIVEAEAGGEDVNTRIAVTDVILNRVESGKFPNNIHDVIFAGKQFTPVSNGRFYSVTISESTKKAVDAALQSPDKSMGALYFMNPNYSDPDNVEWFYTSLTYLFSLGEVEFFR